MTDDTDAPIEDALAAARPRDAPGLALARAKVAGRLFGDAAPAFGRFRVLERLGGGGMGVVYAAYDPQLDRGVALKTVHVPVGSREVALREAKTLAKLSHPHIVPVFDVGLEQDQVYIVMELVRGATLRAWVKDRPPAEVIDTYRQAAEALAAAHDAGLVHRDFKPDNAIVGVDGRVRVVDFGLAAAARAEVSAAGTPAYMAPEQAAGAAPTPAADQYSWCASLAEALGNSPPAWIAAVIARGTAVDPAARFSSMRELLRALARDPARVRKRRLVAAAIVASTLGAAVGAFAVGRAHSGSSATACDGGEEQLADVWSPAAQRADLARIAALSSYGRDVAARVGEQLAEHRTRWIANVRDACLAHRRGEQSDGLLDRRMACLDRSRGALAELADLTRSADANNAPDLVQAVVALPAPDACADVAALVTDVEPAAPAAANHVRAIRSELERARLLIAAGRFADARTLAESAVTAARTVHYDPLIAEASLVTGHALMELHDGRASDVLADALRIGLASGDVAVGIEAWARRAYVVATSGQPEHALAGQDVVEALASRTRSPFARALLANNIGAVELALDRRADARVAFGHALEAARAVVGPGALELVSARDNLAIATDDDAMRDRLLAESRNDLARLLGPDHPQTLRAEWMRETWTILDPATARDALTSSCARDELHPSLASRTALCFVELAEVREALGDRGGARGAIARAHDLGAEMLEEVPEVAGYVALFSGDAASAEQEFNAALAKLPPTAGEPWFHTFMRAKVQLGLARARLALRRDAGGALAAATSALDEIGRAQHAAAAVRRAGAAHALRASSTWPTASPTSRNRTSATTERSRRTSASRSRSRH